MTEQSNNNGNAGEIGAVAKIARTSGAHRLPATGFDVVKPLAQAMVELNGPASRELIFDTAGASSSGGTAKTKWATLGYFGFRVDAGIGNHVPTDRGAAFVGTDSEAAREAMQHALVESGFRTVIERFKGRPVNDAALSGVLMNEFGIPEKTKAESAAKLLVDLATEAGLIVGGSWKVGPIEAAIAVVPDAGTGDSKPAVAKTSPRPKPPAARVVVSAPATPTQGTPQAAAEAASEPVQLGGEGKAGPFELGVEIKIEAQNHAPEEVGEIVREVRRAMTGD